MAMNKKGTLENLQVTLVKRKKKMCEKTFRGEAARPAWDLVFEKGGTSRREKGQGQKR